MSDPAKPPPGWRVVEPGERIEPSDVEAAPLTFGSLFAGVGGMDLGLERAGLECRWQVEIDPYATRVLARHWPDVRRWGNIKTFLPDTASERRGAWGPRRVTARRERRALSSWVAQWRVDLIAGGFPCQDISYAGKGAGLSGERSGLWFEFARVVRTLRPRFVLVENVPALLTRGIDAVLGTLATLGYDAEWECLPASAFGLFHNRDRVFICAYCQGSVQGVFHCSRAEWKAQFQSRRLAGSQAVGAWPADRFPSEPCVAPLVDGVPEWLGRRGIGRGLGNAVVPQVAEWIGRRMIASLPARRLLPVPHWCVGLQARSIGNRVYRRDGEGEPPTGRIDHT